MNTTRHAYSQHEFSASDALFDQIEQDLLALTTAPLDCRGRGAAPERRRVRRRLLQRLEPAAALIRSV
jgi:hypothetical protein